MLAKRLPGILPPLTLDAVFAPTNILRILGQVAPLHVSVTRGLAASAKVPATGQNSSNHKKRLPAHEESGPFSSILYKQFSGQLPDNPLHFQAQQGH